ncbi:glycosyltransferase [uncultured Bacteroides sp.]|jgi:glycosyltransferase|uniref:glycosyltransferase n=1 Tax=uncultured Bacteroides sp. TaxID=162156 RepID=UPI0025896002|nr:glycosyltransferase [uncultured Bacteroides sp.]
MRRTVYVFDEYVSSQKNGIGSFLKEFHYCIKQLNTDVCALIFNANIEEFTVRTGDTGKMEEMLFPRFPIGEFIHNMEIIIKFFRLYIRDSADNIFFVNHSPCDKLVEILKRDYPLSKVVFTIHDLGWTSRCIGDVDRFKKIIGEVDGVEEGAKGVWDFYMKEMRTYELVDRVVCLSRDTYHLLQTAYSLSTEKLSLIPNGVRKEVNGIQYYNQKELRRDLFIPVDEKIVLYVGRPTRQKGVYALLNAFHFLLKKKPSVRLVIIGSDNGNRIENLLTISSGFATRVSFLGLISKEELEKWYAVADVGVIPSYYEQCPYVGIEMMMHGLPVVASDGFGLRNMFQDGVNALIAPIGNREDTEEFSCNLAKAIDELLSSEELRKTLGRNAREIYHSYYSEKQMLKGYKDLLASLD